MKTLYIFYLIFLVYKKNKKSKFLLIIKRNFKFFVVLFFTLFLMNFKILIRKQLKIGVVGVRHEINVGNNLIKYALSIFYRDFLDDIFFYI